MNRWQWMALGAGAGCRGAGGVSGDPSTALMAGGDGDAPGSSVFTDFRGEKPGKIHRITVADLPAPYATDSSLTRLLPSIRPSRGRLAASAVRASRLSNLPGNLKIPDFIRHRPQWRLVFVAGSCPGPHQGLSRHVVSMGKPSFGACVRLRASPCLLESPFTRRAPIRTYVYIANTDSVVRFPYRKRDLVG